MNITITIVLSDAALAVANRIATALERLGLPERPVAAPASSPDVPVAANGWRLPDPKPTAQPIVVPVEPAPSAPPAPPAPPPAPAPSAPVRAPSTYESRGSWRTAERRALLVDEWPRGVPVSEIKETMEAMPGPALPVNVQIGAWAGELFLKRPTRTPAAAVPAAPRSTLPPLPSELQPARRVPLADDAWQDADFATISAWAGARGIQFDGSNLVAVNKRRVSHGFIPFRLEVRAIPARPNSGGSA